MKTRLVAILSGLLIALAGFAIAGAKAPDDSGNPKKEYVCHFTGSAKNPVVIINVGNRAVNAHVDDPSHGHQGDDAASDDRPEDGRDCGGEGEEGGEG